MRHTKGWESNLLGQGWLHTLAQKVVVGGVPVEAMVQVVIHDWARHDRPYTAARLRNARTALRAKVAELEGTPVQTKADAAALLDRLMG